MLFVGVFFLVEGCVGGFGGVFFSFQKYAECELKDLHTKNNGFTDFVVVVFVVWS